METIKLVEHPEMESVTFKENYFQTPGKTNI